MVIMNYGNKNISDMTDIELDNAKNALSKMIDSVNEKRKNPRFLKKFENQIVPPMNLAFTNLYDEINNEILSRKKDN